MITKICEIISANLATHPQFLYLLEMKMFSDESVWSFLIAAVN